MNFLSTARGDELLLLDDCAVLVCVVELVVCIGLATNTSRAERLSNIRKAH